jgi:hypothetical protein
MSLCRMPLMLSISMKSIMLTVILMSAIMLCSYAECIKYVHYVECDYDECCYAECLVACTINIIMIAIGNSRQGILQGNYHCTIDLPCDCQIGSQWYSDTPPFSIPCSRYHHLCGLYNIHVSVVNYYCRDCK